MDEKYIYGLIGMLLVAFLAYTRELLNEKRVRKKEAEYLAIRLVCIFDSFMDGCAKIAGDDGLYMGQRNAEGFLEFQAELPLIDVQLSDVNWKAITPLLMYEILSFQNLINDANSYISCAFEYAFCPPDEDDGFEERQYQYALLGLKADELSKALRYKYKIPQRAPREWGGVDYMAMTKNRITKLREDRAIQNRNAPKVEF